MIPVNQAIKPFTHGCARVFFLQINRNAAKASREKSEFELCVQFGRIFQELWLTFNRAGVAFQPLALPLIALAHWRGTLEFSTEQKRTIDEVSTCSASELGLDLKKPMIAF